MGIMSFAQLNAAAPNKIYPGQQLRIPAKS